MTKYPTRIDGLWRSGVVSETVPYIGRAHSGGPSLAPLIAEGVIGFGVRSTSNDMVLDGTFGMLHCDCSVAIGNTTALAGTASVMTYTVSNSGPNPITAGCLVTVTGAVPAGYNGTNLLVATATSTAFTVLGTISGAQTTPGAVALVSGANRNIYTPTVIADEGTCWYLKKIDSTGNRIAVTIQVSTIDNALTTYLGTSSQGGGFWLYSDGTQWRVFDVYDPPNVSATADALGNPSSSVSGTISPGGFRIKRVNPAAATTNAILSILPATSPPNAGQDVTIFNESANLITFSATTATSHVSVASQTIPALSGKHFVYNAVSSLWYPA